MSERSHAADVTLPFPIRVTIAELPASTRYHRCRRRLPARRRVLRRRSRCSSPMPTTARRSVRWRWRFRPVRRRCSRTSRSAPRRPLPERVRPRAVRQFDVFGRVDLVECDRDGSGTVLLTDDGRAAAPVHGRARPSTPRSSTRAGAPLTCADIAVGRLPARGGISAPPRSDARRAARSSSRRRGRRGRGRARAPSGCAAWSTRCRCERGLIEIEQHAVDPGAPHRAPDRAHRVPVRVRCTGRVRLQRHRRRCADCREWHDLPRAPWSGARRRRLPPERCRAGRSRRHDHTLGMRRPSAGDRGWRCGQSVRVALTADDRDRLRRQRVLPLCRICGRASACACKVTGLPRAGSVTAERVAVLR